MKLSEIAKGALEEQFEAEFQNVLKNIADPNTDAKKQRKITITLTLKPNEKRNIAEMNFQTKSALVPSLPVESNIYIDKDKAGKMVAEELNGQLPGQMSYEDLKKNNVVKM